MKRLTIFFGAWLAVFAAGAEADTPGASSATPGGALDGWGLYKFGMTAVQVHSLDGKTWMALPAIPGLEGSVLAYSPAHSGIDQYGLSFTSIIQRFDRDDKLFSIALLFERGGPTVDGCKQKFQDVLRQLETQYGAFEPESFSPVSGAVAASRTDVVDTLSSAHSRYRDVDLHDIQLQRANASAGAIFHLSSRRRFEKASIEISMNVTDDFRIAGAPLIPAEVTAVDPKLLLPECNINVTFQSRDEAPEAAAIAPVFGTGAARDPQSVQAQARAQTDRIVKDGEKIIADLKQKGFGTGRQDPLSDAYSWELIRHDDEDAEALLAKMTPSQRALAAYAKHDYPLAITLWKPLAEKGDAQAAASVGSLYEYGLNGVVQDYTEAAKWRKVAAQAGDGNSQVTLGEDYAEGRGLPQDNVRAYMWLTAGLKQVENGPLKNWYPQQIATERNTLAAKMSPVELARANALADRCIAAHFKQCEQ